MLLKKFGIAYCYAPSPFKESMTLPLTPAQIAKTNARGKCRAAMVKGRGTVLAADTIVVLKNRILGKPANRRQAERMLMALQARRHRVITAVALRSIKTGRIRCFAISSTVKFKPLAKKQIQAYLNTGEYKDKAGSYGYQGKGRKLIEWVRGSETNVIGLPMERLKQELKRLR